MKAIIIEDENFAVENLRYLLQTIEPDLQIIDVIDTVIDSIDFFNQNNDFDLIFMDIHLADGNSFEILKEVYPAAPIIFTTAYDNYAIKAFKVNSIDYLLKPIQETELKNAIQKFKNLSNINDFSAVQIQDLRSLFQLKQQKFRQSYLVQKGDKLIPIATHDFAFFFIKNGVVRGTTNGNLTYHLDAKLEDLENELNSNDFFRANRQYLIQRYAIKNLSFYNNGRLIINTSPNSIEQIIVSKANKPKIKSWLNQN
ncbi:MAG: LytTR family DNA-binding domain-containing protein [Saprospiraceae bacterium]|nr:LytTR family DNA-binding domain-containing protein [Saprospiraceae bacterium]MDG2417466.1 LytTR family DNA-binding domain-containing protein [Saprospiraceae bacterium]